MPEKTLVRIHVGVTSPVDAGLHPYPRHVARRQVCSRHTVSLDIGLSHPHTPGIIHDDAHTIALPSVCRYRLVIIAKVVEDLLCMKFMWLQCDAAGIARRVALVARPSLITLKSSSCTYLLFCLAIQKFFYTALFSRGFHFQIQNPIWG